MPAQEDETQRLRELHEAYAWEVNAAIAEGREDIVWKLADDYLSAAMVAMTEAHGTGCEQPNCAICARRRPDRPQIAPAQPEHWRSDSSAPRRGWFRRFFFGEGGQESV